METSFLKLIPENEVEKMLFTFWLLYFSFVWYKRSNNTIDSQINGRRGFLKFLEKFELLELICTLLFEICSLC